MEYQNIGVYSNQSNFSLNIEKKEGLVKKVVAEGIQKEILDKIDLKYKSPSWSDSWSDGPSWLDGPGWSASP